MEEEILDLSDDDKSFLSFEDSFYSLNEDIDLEKEDYKTIVHC